MAKFKRKRITKEMIKRHFSEVGCEFEIKELWVKDGWRVTTDTGGEVLIFSEKGHKFISGGEDTLRAVTLIFKEAWGHCGRVSGSPEFITAMMAHAEVEGVNVIPVVEDSSAGCLRFFVTLLILLSCVVTGPVGVIAAVIVWQAMTKAEERAERRRGQVYRNALPSVLTGPTRESSYEIAKRRGLI